MNLKAIPFFFIVVTGSIKFFTMLVKPDTFSLVAFALFSLMWAWISWAYWKDKQMPSYAGSFKYLGGKNHFIRTVYVLVMLSLYLLGLVAA